MIKAHMITAIVLCAGIALFNAYTGGFRAEAQEQRYTDLPRAGAKYEINPHTFFTYEFNRRPAIGTLIVKIVVTGKDGAKRTDLQIKGDSGMPSMRGHHDSGDVLFQKNRKGDYLLPVNVVMPGDWEVRLKFFQGGKIIYHGSIKFDV